MFVLNKLAIFLSIYKVITVPKVMFRAIKSFFAIHYTPPNNFKETLLQEYFSLLQCECRSHFLTLQLFVSSISLLY